ncbi:hypothetical protein GQ457_15G020480 [Hibiscus cannabinus]
MQTNDVTYEFAINDFINETAYQHLKYNVLDRPPTTLFTLYEKVQPYVENKEASRLRGQARGSQNIDFQTNVCTSRRGRPLLQDRAGRARFIGFQQGAHQYIGVSRGGAMMELKLVPLSSDGAQSGGSSGVASKVSGTFTNKKVNVVLDEFNFLVWKQQVLLAIRSLRLEKLLTSSLKAPLATIRAPDGTMIENEASEVFVAQDSARSTTTVMSLHYKLRSLKKGDMSMRAYVSQVKEICNALASSGSPISDLETIATILNGLSVEYQLFVVVITASREPFTLDATISVLLDVEVQLSSFNTLSDISSKLNVVHASISTLDTNRDSASATTRPYRQSSNGRGKSGRMRLQCQLCGKLGHLVDRCRHRFDEDFVPVTARANDLPKNEVNSMFVSNPDLSLHSCSCHCAGGVPSSTESSGSKVAVSRAIPLVHGVETLWTAEPWACWYSDALGCSNESCTNRPISPGVSMDQSCRMVLADFSVSSTATPVPCQSPADSSCVATCSGLNSTSFEPADELEPAVGLEPASQVTHELDNVVDSGCSLKDKRCLYFLGLITGLCRQKEVKILPATVMIPTRKEWKKKEYLRLIQVLNATPQAFVEATASSKEDALATNTAYATSLTELALLLN